ncbi:hypothetical protein, partial [Streptomyces sp. NPDC048845]|uniref:hypothetical protein n=1 Tax=Streptomyces sp. NPDC048845 TaxID=3155390 RepID=UPI003426613D
AARAPVWRGRRPPWPPPPRPCSPAASRTGKRIEVPVKRLFQGTALDKAVNPGSVDDVELLRFYEGVARGRSGGTA